MQRPQTISGVALGVAPARQGEPAAIVSTTSTAADGAYASIVVRNDGTKPIRAVVVAASVRPALAPDESPMVFTSPTLVTWIPPGSSRALEPRLIDPATLARVGSRWEKGATAVVSVVRVEFNDDTVWTPAGRNPASNASPTGQVGSQVESMKSQTGDEFGAGAYRPGVGVNNPIVIRQVHPKYTSDAMRAKIEGVVEVEAVIKTDGTVGDVRVVKSLDNLFGLDEQALDAARQWRFTPAMRNGEAVPIVVIIQLQFKLH